MTSVWSRASAGILLCLSLGADGSAQGSRGSGPEPATVDVADAIRQFVALGQDAAFGLISPAERAHVTAFYGPDGFAPLWVDPSGRPTGEAAAAMRMLRQAADEGLEPSDYRADLLAGLAGALEAAHAPTAQDIAAFDTGLSVNTLRYLRHLHAGRVDPRTIGFRMTAPADDHDFAALLRAARDSHRIADMAPDVAPPLALYRGLRRMLAHYRSLAADAALGSLAPSGTTVRPGQPYDGLGALHGQLVSLGDLEPDVPSPTASSAYDGPYVEGVKRFQSRHGLEPDGVLGTATQAALRVPLSWRIRQIELALERLRWLPHLGEQRLLAVNIPMFRVWGWDRIPPNGAPSFGTGVIVGRALNTQTPVFVEEMRYLILPPYWNVPSSILRHELLPALARDPDYFRRQDLEIVSGPGDNARPVAVTAESIAQLRRRGPLRVRQRPGPKNSLGLVKFVFPNDANVYLHGTPAQQLFSRSRRDFSHGCVRVEDPVALAEWALEDQPGWTRERIVAAMDATPSRRIDLARPIQVILFYVTAVVMPEDGTIRFADDIYGHDARLDRALRLRRASP